MFDLQLDLQTGDFVISPDNDIAGLSGSPVHLLRMHIRLMIQKGKWILDFTEGELGSRLPTLLRQEIDVGIAEAELLIREALEPMDDVEVVEIHVFRHPQDPRKISARITLRPLVSVLLPNALSEVVELTFGG